MQGSLELNMYAMAIEESNSFDSNSRSSQLLFEFAPEMFAVRVRVRVAQDLKYWYNLSTNISSDYICKQMKFLVSRKPGSFMLNKYAMAIEESNSIESNSL